MRHPIIAEDCATALNATRDLWNEVQGKRIFITGGTGFFGCWFLELLTYAADTLAFDCEAVVLTRAPEAFAAGRAGHLAAHRCVRLQRDDVRDFAFPEGPFPLVAHFGSTGPKAMATQPEAFFDLIVRGTQHVLEFAENAQTQRLLLASTGAIYGPHPTGALHGLNENYRGAPDSTDPASANAEGKRAAEFLAACLVRRRPELAVGIARGFTFVGPYLSQEAGFAVADFLRAAQAGREIAIHGDGTPIRSYLYGADLAVWLWTILLRTPEGAARAWNVGAEEPISIHELAAMTANLRAPNLPITVLRTPETDSPKDVYLPDTTQAQSLLKLKQSIPLDCALRRTLTWMEREASC